MKFAPLTRLPAATRPQGWVARLMEKDFREGFVGHLDKLVPSLFLDDIYGSDRLTNAVKSKDVGATTGVDNENSAQFLWWNSETQSNWRDGWLRHALLVGGDEGRRQADVYVKRVLATQDADGYLGIYAPDLRYRFSGENGELWAQATLLRGLLAYYELTVEQRVLDAVVRAVKLTREAWPLPKSRPFQQPGSFAGNAHGLMFVDVLDRLADLTGDLSYRDYAVLLYEDYCRSDVSEPDSQLQNLLDPAYRFAGHGVHTWEHLRALVLAATHAPRPEFDLALGAYLRRLDECLLPSGAPIGDEWISGRWADADETATEYCSILELLDGYLLLLAKTGDALWADRAEHLLFNAALGARHPHEASIAYLKTDNSYSMTGVKHHDRREEDDATQTRYRYSPAHQEAAVCCVPNAGKVFPSAVQSQVLLGAAGPVVALYGASVSRLAWAGTAVTLEQITAWPDDLRVVLRLDPERPVEFTLSLRRPAWAVSVEVDCFGAVVDTSGPWLQITKTWTAGDRVELEFRCEVELGTDLRGQKYFQRGPLVYALPLDHRTEVTREWPFGGFRESLAWPIDGEAAQRFLPADVLTRAVAHRGYLVVPLADEQGNQTLTRLVPLKETLLRRVTFAASAAYLKPHLDEIADRVAARWPSVPNLARLYRNAYPNTLQTTLRTLADGSVFLLTGDIPAMWLRDSTAQVHHYLPMATLPELQTVFEGLLKRQFASILLDPYANAFNAEPNNAGHKTDLTEHNPWVWERKYEVDSLCSPLQLAWKYWKATGVTRHFTPEFHQAALRIVDLWTVEQNHREFSTYRFTRQNCPPHDTIHHEGQGAPVAYTGLTWSGFRPSDDACVYGYNLAQNAFAAVVLGYLAEIGRVLYDDSVLVGHAERLEREIREAIAVHGVVSHPEFGRIYAYELDGLGHHLLQDDANLPNLLSLPYLGFCRADDEVYQNTRRFCLSPANPYYFEGTKARGLGSPHTPPDYIWPLGLSVQGLTAAEPAERDELLALLARTDADTGWLHEGFHADHPERYTRPWFAWANSLFAEFVERSLDPR
ncbi:MAG: glycoside hydrolase family 125 protein [Spirochaetales bacterium]